MIVVIGSLRKPKVAAVEAAFAKIAPAFGQAAQPFEMRCFAVESGISNTPLSMAEMMQGARNRVSALVQHCRPEPPRRMFYLGLEGGLFASPAAEETEAFYLQSWVYASDGRQGAYGASPAVRLPSGIAAQCRTAGFELADAMDALVQQHNTREQGGAFAIFTRGQLTRQRIFETAVLAAMAPFYNSSLYAP